MHFFLAKKGLLDFLAGRVEKARASLRWVLIGLRDLVFFFAKFLLFGKILPTVLRLSVFGPFGTKVEDTGWHGSIFGPEGTKNGGTRLVWRRSTGPRPSPTGAVASVHRSLPFGRPSREVRVLLRKR